MTILEGSRCTVTFLSFRGTRQSSWLRHYAISRKVTGSIPDVAGFLN
jgi:hypothetical protein